MTPASTGGGTPDHLTRTMLQIQAGVSAQSLAGAIRALQRVPGVLLADVDAASARATVAHDAGVPPASLLAAVVATGVQAKIIAGARPVIAVPGALPVTWLLPSRTLLTVVAAAIVLLALADAFVPRLMASRWLFPALLCAFWAFVFARAVLRRKP